MTSIVVLIFACLVGPAFPQNNQGYCFPSDNGHNGIIWGNNDTNGDNGNNGSQGRQGGDGDPDLGSVINTPDRYQYRQIRSLRRNQTSIRFQVQAANDAHVALHRFAGDTRRQMYEFVIGGWRNSRSVIRDRPQGRNRVSRRHRPLSEHSYRRFWISWDDDGRVRIGYGWRVGRRQFLQWRNRNPFRIRYLSISTGWGATGRWQFERQSGGAIRIVTPGNGDYQQVDVVTQQLRENQEFPFYVRASRGAHILLQRRRGDENFNVFEIVIGARGNSRSEIRRGKNGRVLDYANHTPLSENHFIPFWIRYRNGFLSVGFGHQPGYYRFLSHENRRRFPIRFASITTRNGVRGTWFFKPNS